MGQRGLQLRLVSLNVWHGLDHSKPLSMPRVESKFENQTRMQSILSALEAWRAHQSKACHVYLFQELNPVEALAKSWASKLHMTPTWSHSNFGLKAGLIKYPFFLDEGLGTLVDSRSELLWSKELELSGSETKFQNHSIAKLLPFSVRLHFAERRLGLLSQFRFEGATIGVVNVHLHNGSPEEGSRVRRLNEMKVLVPAIRDLCAKSDVVIVGGDFNAESSHPELQLLLDLGFQESLCPDRSKRITWDPSLNPWTKRSNQIGKHRAAAQGWEESPHTFDHLLYWTRHGATGHASRLLDSQSPGGPQSDHYALTLDLELQ